MLCERSRPGATVAAVVRLEMALDHAIAAAKHYCSYRTGEALYHHVSWERMCLTKRLIRLSSHGFGIDGPSISEQFQQQSVEDPIAQLRCLRTLDTGAIPTTIN